MPDSVPEMIRRFLAIRELGDRQGSVSDLYDLEVAHGFTASGHLLKPPFAIDYEVKAGQMGVHSFDVETKTQKHVTI